MVCAGMTAAMRPPGRNEIGMSDTDGKKPLGLGGGSGRSGQVKQSFSHGRTHNVAVEVKRKRVIVPGKPAAAGGARAGSPSAIGGDPSKRPAGISDAEMERRMAALRAAKAREVEEAAQREAEEKAREEERERRRLEAEAKEREDREREEALRLKAEEDERRAREAELRAQKKAEVTKPKAPEARPAPADRAAAEAAAARAETKGVTSTAPRKTERERDTRTTTDDRDNRNKGRDDSRRTGKLSLSQAMDGEGGRQRSLAAMKRKQEKARQKAMGGNMRQEKQVRDVQLPETILVSELANRMAERTPDVIKSLMRMGLMVTANQAIDADTAELVIDEFGRVAGLVTIEDVLEQIVGNIEDEYDLDQSHDNIRRDAGGRFVVKASTSIEDFNTAFCCDFPADEFDTIGGFLLGELGYVAKRNEIISLAGIRFQVLRADSRRLYTLLVDLLPPTEEQADD
jgi:translation initiation factor IF-2